MNIEGGGQTAPAHAWVTALLQTADALFPTGAYAHSFGFESCVQLGVVRDEATLVDFLREHLAPALAELELPYVRFAREAADDLETLAALDTETGAVKLARETREASARLGVRRLRSLRVIFPDDARLAACDDAVASGSMAGHHAIICGVQAAVAGVPLGAALAAYYYQAMAAVCGAAPKLLRIGQEAVQRALCAAGHVAETAVARSLEIPRVEAGWFNPLLEIASMRHERAGERLFIS